MRLLPFAAAVGSSDAARSLSSATANHGAILGRLRRGIDLCKAVGICKGKARLRQRHPDSGTYVAIIVADPMEDIP
jgi:hypothetical protein